MKFRFYIVVDLNFISDGYILSCHHSNKDYINLNFGSSGYIIRYIT